MKDVTLAGGDVLEMLLHQCGWYPAGPSMDGRLERTWKVHLTHVPRGHSVRDEM